MPVVLHREEQVLNNTTIPYLSRENVCKKILPAWISGVQLEQSVDACWRGVGCYLRKLETLRRRIVIRFPPHGPDAHAM